MAYDFSGYVTKNDVRCSDGRVIRHGAFADCDGKRVPLVWQHVHDDPNNVLGYVDLENRDDGVYGRASLNSTSAGKNAAELIKHGDIDAMSIYANQLKQRGSDVIHGVIREVSLVLSGANPEARIENLSFAHSDGTIDEIEEEAVIYMNSGIKNEEPTIRHADSEPAEPTIEDIFNTLDDNQLNAVYALVGTILQENDSAQHGAVASVADTDYEDFSVLDSLTEEQAAAVINIVDQVLADNGIDPNALMEEDDDDAEDYIYEDEDESEEDGEDDGDGDATDGGEAAQSGIPVEEGTLMHRNVFEGVDENTENGQVLTHSQIHDIVASAQRAGSLKTAFEDAGFADIAVTDDSLQHGITDIDILFPEAKNATPTPSVIARPQQWVPRVLNAVRKSPFNRIKSTAANLTADEARARGYIKGKKKIEEQIKLLKRVTTPQTIYKLQKFDRDDIIDITDLDVVSWIKGEMRMMLNEELARAILVGDGRNDVDESKIKEDNIRPILSDADTYAVHYRTSTTVPKTTEELEAFIDAIIRAKKDYKGSGSPTLFIGNDLLTSMRLIRDRDGYRRYKTDQELADDLRVSSICEVQLLDDLKPREVGGKQLSFGCIIVNLSDYMMGANRGGQVTLFDDFDIDYNKYSYLIETRCCGCLIQPASALVFEFGEPAD